MAGERTPFISTFNVIPIFFFATQQIAMIVNLCIYREVSCNKFFFFFFVDIMPLHIAL